MKVSTSRVVFQIFNYSFLGILALSCLVPIFHVLSVSLSQSSAAAANKVYLWPVGFNVQAYQYVLERTAFWKAFGITGQRIILGVAINVVITLMMSYPLSKEKRELKGRNIYMGILIFAMLFNGGLVPFLLTMKSLGLMDTVWALVLPSSVPIFSIILVTNNIRMLPKAVEEAALIDGASYFEVLLWVLIPMLKPVIATITLLSFILHFNSWFDGLVLMNKIENYPLQTFLSLVVRNVEVKSMEESKMFRDLNNQTLKSAQLFVTLIPILAVYPFLQKYFTQGLVVGAVKG